LMLKLRPAEAIFSSIFFGNKWGGKESVSGRGSDLLQTRVIRNELKSVYSGFHIQTILDIPCDDFYWMNHVDLEGMDYTGADIVGELIEQNKQQYEKRNIHFCKLNLIKDKLPKVDLLFCRDCLVHFSFKDIFLALRNVCDSGSEYLLTTTFTSRLHNDDIATGQWRAPNFEVAPFAFPPPLRTINEECTEDDGAFKDKSLALWRVADIKECVIRQGRRGA